MFYIFRTERYPDEAIPPEGIKFKVHVENDIQKVYKHIQDALQRYKEKKLGPTLLAVQSCDDIQILQMKMSNFGDFPQIPVHVRVNMTHQTKIIARKRVIKFFRISMIFITVWSGKKSAPRLS